MAAWSGPVFIANSSATTPSDFDFRPPGKIFIEEYAKFIASRNELLGSAGHSRGSPRVRVEEVDAIFRGTNGRCRIVKMARLGGISGLLGASILLLSAVVTAFVYQGRSGESVFPAESFRFRARAGQHFCLGFALQPGPDSKQCLFGSVHNEPGIAFPGIGGASLVASGCSTATRVG